MTTERLNLAPGVRLQWETVQNTHVLLYPEGMVKLNVSAAEILKHCDGTLTREGLVQKVECVFERSNLEQEIGAFVAHAIGNGWLQAQP